MPIITIKPSGKIVEMPVGSTLAAAVIAAGEPMVLKCEGKGECESCHIFVQEGRKSLSKIQRAENEQLDRIVGVGSKSRLACQATIGEEDIVIELLGFSSGL